MTGENGVPETPEWTVTAKPWDARACCANCANVCETPPLIERGEN